MSNAVGDIDEVIGEKAYQNVERMINLLGGLRVTYNGTVKDIISGVKEMDKATSVKSVTTQMDNLVTKTKKMKDVQTEFVQTQQNVDNALRNTGDALNQLDRELVKVTNGLKGTSTSTRTQIEENNKLKVSIQTVDQQWKLLEADYKRLTAEARNMGAAHGIMSKEFKTSSAAANIVRKEMDGINKSLGHHQSNVGNYESGLKKLWGGFRQLANVLPGVGLSGLLLIMYDIVSVPFEKYLDGVVKKFDLFGDSAKKSAEELKRISEYVAEETGKFETLNRQLKDSTLSREAHLKVAKELKELYPTALKNYSLEEIAAGKAAGAIRLISNALVEVAKARAAQEDLNKIAAQNYEREKNVAKLNADLIKEELAVRKQYELLNSGNGFNSGSIGQDISRRENNIIALREQIQALNTATYNANLEMNKIANSISKAGEAADKAGVKLSDGSDVTKGAKKPKAGKKAKEATVFNLDIFDDEATIKELQQYYDKLKEAQLKALGEWVNDPELMRLAEEALTLDMDNIIAKGRGSTTNDQARDLQQQLTDYFEQKKKNQELDKQELEDFNSKIKAVTEMIKSFEIAYRSIVDAFVTRANVYADTELKNIDRVEKAELDSLDRRTMSVKKKEDEKKKIELEAQARRDKIERDRIQTLRRAAIFEKGLDIAKIIASTAKAVMKAYNDYPAPYNIAAAIATGAAGAAQVASIVATPLPQYAKGRKGGKAEFAVVNEVGPEIVFDGDKAYIPNKGKKGVTFLPEGADVIPHHEILKNSAYVKLAQAGAATTDKLQDALITSFLEMNLDELKSLRSTLEQKEFASYFYGSTEHLERIKKQIR